MFDSTAAIALAALALFAPVSAQNNYVLSQGGSTGVAAMQLTVASDSTVVIIDKFEQNVLHDETDHPVWGAVYSTKTDTARPLHLVTNSFCATGTWISNGTLTFNWQTNTETRLPNLPNGQIVTYPYSGVGVLLPLTPENNYTPEVLICGGSQLDPTLKENEVSSQSPTSAQCSRLVLTTAGIAAGWQVESMPYGRVMLDATILPDGKILIVNGGKTGTAGYGNVPDQIGQSNADNPAFQPLLYDPAAAAGSRFSSSGMPTSDIARLYHSVSTLLPDGRVLIAGSNPNLDVETRKYRTEYQVEYISPPYMTKTRPTYSGLPSTWNYGQQITLTVTLPPSLNPQPVTCALMDLGYSTHGVHMDMRMVKVTCTVASNKKSITITGPPNAAVYPPGPAWLYISAGGVPSKAQKVLIGNGGSPPVDQGAIDNMLANTGGP
ncbi:hypothetical protein FRC06_005230 [Ceratobasidium sp. 370]|nr:hypothetical protein FRC06_005230 [Ceratobasidium sp. 370]